MQNSGLIFHVKGNNMEKEPRYSMLFGLTNGFTLKCGALARCKEGPDQDQRETDYKSEGDRFAEHDHAQDHGNGRVYVGDDCGAGWSNFGDEGEKQDESQGCADGAKDGNG